MESNLVSVNAVGFPVGNDQEITYEISEKFGETCKIKIVAATVINMNR